jgi:LemA protein
MPKKPTAKKAKAAEVNTPPYEINIGDRLYPDTMPKLGPDKVLRTLIVTTDPYLVGNEWKVMVTDKNDNYWTLELDMGGFHVVGRTKKREQAKPEEKPKLVKGDIVQMLHCPKYPSLETHKAKLTGDPYEAFGSWKAPIKYHCNGSETAIYDCSKLAFIRHPVIKPSFWQELYNKVRGKYMKLSKPAIVTAVVLAVVGILLLVGVGNYNDLVRSRNQVSNNRAQIDTEYTRRYDLIDNIVQSVQGSQAQESDVFGKIAEARKIGGSGSASAQTEEQANNTIDTQIALLPRLQEAYPELKSNDQVSKLIAELQGTNNTIRDKKNTYNTTVTNYNTNITSFPKNIFAGIFNFDKEKLLEATAQERVNPKVELDREKN